MALAGSAPRQHGKTWQRGSGEKLTQGAVAQQRVARLSPGTMRRWRRADKLKPGRYPSWPHSPEPQLVEQAPPVLDLYAQAPALHADGALPVCAEEKTAIPARQRVTATHTAVPGAVRQGADR